MQSVHKTAPASVPFFYGRRESNGALAPHEAPPLSLLSGAFFNKKIRNSEKSASSNVCVLHSGAFWGMCQGCRRHACSDCLASGEHQRVCPVPPAADRSVLAATHFAEHFARLQGAHEKALSDLQLNQITTVSQVEDCFNSLIFEIENQKKLAIEAVKTHFLSAGKKLECLKGEADRLARRPPAAGTEQQLRALTAGAAAFASQNRFVYEFDKSRLEAVKSCFKISQSTCSLADEPNLLNFSIDGDDFVSLMAASKPNSMVFDQTGTESKPMGDAGAPKPMGRLYSSSRKRQSESRGETGSLFNARVERNFNHFQSVYAALAKDKLGKKMTTNKENIVLKTRQLNSPYGGVGAVRSTGDCAMFNTPDFQEAKSGGFENGHGLANNSKISFFNSCTKFKKPGVEPEKSQSSVGPMELSLANLGAGSSQLMERVMGEPMPNLIRVVDVSGNPLEDRGMRQFLKGLTQLKVEKLACNNTGLTELALDYFISFRKYNDRLQAIWLRGNRIDENRSSVAKKLRILRDWGIQIHL